MIMRLRRGIESKLTLWGLALLFLSACATQVEPSDGARVDEEAIQNMIRHDQEMNEKIFESTENAFAPRDLETMTFKERRDQELLKNLQNELPGDTRVPATESSPESKEALPLPGQSQSKTQQIIDEQLKRGSLVFDRIAAQFPGEASPADMESVQSVTISQGDTMSGLAQKHLGHMGEWKRIWSLNPQIQDPNRIDVGMTLKLPRSTTNPLQHDSTDNKTTVSAENKEIPAQGASSNESKKIPQLEPKVAYENQRVVASKTKSDYKAKFATEPAPVMKASDDKASDEISKTTAQLIESAFSPPGTNPNGHHSVKELQKEVADAKKLTVTEATIQNKKAEVTPEAKTPKERDPASATAEEAAMAKKVPKALAKLIGFLGFLLLAGVLGSFFFTKPQKNS